MAQVRAPSPLSSMLGIVTYFTEVELGRGEPDVFVAAARGPDTKELGYPTSASLVGSGAGLSWEDARGAAIGECLERYAACVIDTDHLLVGSYDQLIESGRKAHEPASWALFDTTQAVPYPAFTRDSKIVWVEGWSLVSAEPIYLPACFAYLSSSPLLRQDGADVLGPGVSTGCACARAIDEALLKGLCELIERDAFLIVWRNRLAIHEIEIDAGSSIFETFRSKFARPGLEYRIWQTTLDLSMPSFFGMLFDHRRGETRTIVGGAANPDGERAVLKTLCELVQGLSWLDYMSSQKRPVPSDFDQVRDFTDRALLYASRSLPDACPFLFNRGQRIPLSRIASPPRSVDTRLQHSVKLLVQKGFHPTAVDLTPDDVRECGYVVSRVVVPGLETMDGDHRLQMLGGNRWRDVPVSLGLLTAETSLGNINPFPHPYP